MEIKPDIETFAKIKVIGVGGSGGSTINTMIRNNIKGVEFVAVNTDAQALHNNLAATKIHIGKTITRGLGAGMDPEVGAKAAEENQNEIREILKNTDMVFVTCGMGGGTGTGAAPVIAGIARELGALTIGVVTKPFTFEGVLRKNLADRGYDEMVSNVDTVITIPNDRILQIIDKKTSLLEAFQIVDDVLRQGVEGIAELVTVHGRTNVDFADVKSIMQDAGSALMGIGYGSGDNRAVEAAKAAVSSPLLEQSIQGAKGILFTVAGSKDLGMMELHEAAQLITEQADPNAKIIYGTVLDEDMKDSIKITVIATGFNSDQAAKKVEESRPEVESLSRYSQKISSSPWHAANINMTQASQPVIDEDDDEDAIVDETPDYMRQPAETKEDEAKREAERIAEEVASSVPDADDDLEIPAFIRKKMM